MWVEEARWVSAPCPAAPPHLHPTAQTLEDLAAAPLAQEPLGAVGAPADLQLALRHLPVVCAHARQGILRIRFRDAGVPGAGWPAAPCGRPRAAALAQKLFPVAGLHPAHSGVAGLTRRTEALGALCEPAAGGRPAVVDALAFEGCPCAHAQSSLLALQHSEATGWLPEPLQPSCLPNWALSSLLIEHIAWARCTGQGTCLGRVCLLSVRLRAGHMLPSPPVNPPSKRPNYHCSSVRGTATIVSERQNG